MDLKKFTEKAQEALVGSQELARGMNHPQVDPEHLLTVLVEQPEGVVPGVLRRMNVDPRRVAAAARAALTRRPQVYGAGTPGLSPRLVAIVDLAQAEAA
ncbi:MAG: type VI secretion system ATPase TssH, partial [Acidobacteria bacterium]